MDNMFHLLDTVCRIATIHKIYGYSSPFLSSILVFVKSHSVNGHNSLMYENIFAHGSKDTPAVCLYTCPTASTMSAWIYFSCT
jgi:hypothetical protein